MAKAPLARKDVGPNPTDRGKNGSKRHLLADERGILLSIVVTGANRPDLSQLKMETMHSAPHVRQRGEGEEEAEAKKAIAGYKPRRWIVKVAHSCFN